MRKCRHGFTLIELMMVIAVIGILSTIALPTYQDRIIRAQIEDAMALSVGIKQAVEEFHSRHQRFPTDNAEAGAPKPEHLIGNHVTGIKIGEGAIHIALGHRINAHVRGKGVTLRPATVTGSPESPISWLCGYAEAVTGMRAAGKNETSVHENFLPVPCRRW